MSTKKTVPPVKIKITRRQSNNNDPLRSPLTPSSSKKNNTSEIHTKIFSSPNRYSILNESSSFEFNNTKNTENITDKSTDNIATNNCTTDSTPLRLMNLQKKLKYLQFSS